MTAISYILELTSIILTICITTGNACTMTGCKDGMCFTSGSDIKCSSCMTGYYKSITLENCNQCNPRCLSCTSYDACLTCNTGYYLPAESTQCNSCSANCRICKTTTECTQCEEGSLLTDTKACSDGSQASQQQTTGKSMTGEIVGYCVSGVVVILCCVITILYQKKKQEQEEEERRNFKEMQKNKNIGVSGSGVEDGTQNYELDVVDEDQDADRQPQMFKGGLVPQPANIQRSSVYSNDRGVNMISTSSRLKPDGNIISENTPTLTKPIQNQLVKRDIAKSSGKQELAKFGRIDVDGKH